MDEVIDWQHKHFMSEVAKYLVAGDKIVIACRVSDYRKLQKQTLDGNVIAGARVLNLEPVLRDQIEEYVEQMPAQQANVVRDALTADRHGTLHNVLDNPLHLALLARWLSVPSTQDQSADFKRLSEVDRESAVGLLLELYFEAVFSDPSLGGKGTAPQPSDG